MFRDIESFPAYKQKEVVEVIKQQSLPLETSSDLDPLIDRIGDAKIVMLGEASHGTHDYYTWRARITKRLIEEKGFNFISVEGDWPDCYNVNRYIKHYSTDESAYDVLHRFNRWPTWMWANWEIVALAEWLYQHNASLSNQQKVGFYGLDVYSLWDSMNSVKEYLAKVDPAALKVAEEAFTCFDPYKKDDGQSYAYASQMVPELCEHEVVTLLQEIRKKMPSFDGDHENAFSTEQNALVAVNAEKYYRAMVKGGPESWNVRDSHMFETLQRLLKFHGPDAKAIIWEHNTHIGDSRYTDMTDEGMYNIGELVRDHYSKEDVVLVGFGSYVGTVIAANRWGADMRKMKMPKARDGSWEELLHRAGASNKLLLLDQVVDVTMLEERIGHRAIGVVYNPEFEMYGNYVPSIVPLRYDAFLYINQTTALHPLHNEVNQKEIPDTYPFGM